MAKAGRPKKNSAGLPDWFDIQKYRVVKDFRAMGWFHQLATRKQFFEVAEHSKKSDNDLQEDLNEALALIKENPVITYDRIRSAPKKSSLVDGKKTSVLDRALWYALTALYQDAIGVRDVDFRQILRLAAALKDEWQLAIAALLSWKFIKPKDAPLLFQKVRIYTPQGDNFFSNLFDQWKESFAIIDLSLPDEVLMKDYAAYLKEKRKRCGYVEGPFFKNPDFRSWYDSGVLAYLDLMLWESVTGESVRWAAFADALNEIVDTPIGGESTLSKTTKAHARKLMDTRTIKILQSQAMREETADDLQSEKLLVR